MSDVSIRPSAYKFSRTDAVMFAVGVGLLSGALGISFVAFSDVGDALIRNTIRLSLAWYLAAVLLLMRLCPSDWTAATTLGRIARWCWTFGCLVFLVHLGMAFHYYHHWSWRHAFEHTRQVAGIGEGIYVSYLFTWLWFADVAWWWLSPTNYGRRSPWCGRLLHGFMLFIVFNGTVIYEQGPIRYAGMAASIILIATWLRVRRNT